MVFHIFSTSEKPKGHINVWQQSAVLSCFFGCFCLIKNACIIFTSHVLTVDAREKRHRHHSDTDTWLRNPKQPPGMVIKPYEMLGYPTNLNWWSPDFFSHQPVQSMAWKKQEIHMPSFFPKQNGSFCSTHFTWKFWEMDRESFWGRTSAKGAENHPQQTIIKFGRCIQNVCQFFGVSNWRPCCCLFHLEITHFEQVKRLPPLPTFPKWLDQWSKIHSPCHPRCRAILRCINSTKPPQPTVVLEEETDSPMEKKWSKKTKRLSQVID